MNKLKLILRRRWPVLLAGVVIGCLVSLVVRVGGDEPVAQWRATQIVFLDLTQTDATSGNTVISQGAALMTQGRVPQEAAAALDFDGEPADLAEKITALPDNESLSIKIWTADEDAIVASERVSAFADAFISVVSSQSLDERRQAVDTAQASFDAATEALKTFDERNPGIADVVPIDQDQARLVSVRTDLVESFAAAEEDLKAANDALELGALYFTQGPEKPEKVGVSAFRIPQSRWFNIAALASLGLALSAALVALLERFNPRIDTKHDIDHRFDVPVVGEVMKLRRMHRQGRNRAPVSLDMPSAESYRRIRSVFRFAINRNAEARLAAEGPGATDITSVFMVVSALPDEGKSTTVAMTGLALAEAGVRTLVVGCDYRRPTIDRLLGVPATLGITSRAVMSIDRPRLADIIFATPHENLWIAPSGPSATNVAGCADVTREIVAAARAEGLVVIIDTTPMLLANDAAELFDVVDDIVLVVRSGQTPVSAIAQVIDQLGQQGRELLGAVLIGSPDLNRMLNYYSDYYDDGRGRTGDAPSGTPSQPPSQPPPGAYPPHAANGAMGPGNGSGPPQTAPTEAMR